jgi:hypothetical protein
MKAIADISKRDNNGAIALFLPRRGQISIDGKTTRKILSLYLDNLFHRFVVLLDEKILQF